MQVKRILPQPSQQVVCFLSFFPSRRNEFYNKRRKELRETKYEGCSENRRETAKRERESVCVCAHSKRDRKRTPKGGRRLAHHTPLLKIPVWWRRGTRRAVLPSLPWPLCFLSFALLFLPQNDDGRKRGRKVHEINRARWSVCKPAPLISTKQLSFSVYVALTYIPVGGHLRERETVVFCSFYVRPCRAHLSLCCARREPAPFALTWQPTLFARLARAA